jgi:2-isopropylmalate synthase
MSVQRKRKLFQLLTDIGFKEIEIGFPAASQTELDFTRDLIDNGRIPDDVTPMVMTQAREDLMRRTFESLAGARRVIVSLFNSTTPVWRELYGHSVQQVVRQVDEYVRLFRRMAEDHPQTDWLLQYSPEGFSMTEPQVALDACNTAIEAWDAGAGRPIIVNLPATVEVATPNAFADQVEWMHRHLLRREHVTLSVHPHNDRGTGVAAAEQALLAGAQRVEGCLFGNGERCGNLDLVTLALNLYTHGVDPGLDFSNIDNVARVAQECTQIPVHPRHPYAGDFVYTAFSGSHQDAIRRGLAAQHGKARWNVPYLPIDPADVGRSYAGLIRVNSQSGKGGMAFLLDRDWGIKLPRKAQIDFSSIVQRHADASGTEMTSQDLWRVFEAAYLSQDGGIVCKSHRIHADDSQVRVDIEVSANGETRRLQGSGTCIGAATANAVSPSLRFDTHDMQESNPKLGGRAHALVELASERAAAFGAGVHEESATAIIQAVLNASARLAR